MLIMKVKKVRQSQPHWHLAHDKKFVRHIRTPHVLGTTIKHKYCINSREVRKKPQAGSRLGRSRICKKFARKKFVQNSQHVQDSGWPRCNLQRLRGPFAG